MATMAETKLILTPVTSLHFDRSNPRLAEYGISTETTDDDILVILWEAMDVMELVQSIASSGFFPHEALVVSREHNRNIVIEGNRRLAAVKVLLDDQVAKKKGWGVPTISDTAKKKLESLPVIFSNRQESWRYLGKV